MSQTSLTPISPNKRIDSMDILRGLALVGILMMNIEWFGRSMLTIGSFDPDLTGLDHAAGWFVRCFVEGKFYKIFALLFGMGFAVMLLRAKEAGRPFGAWFVRRMVVLYIFGLLHMFFLWGGDILHDYALAGLMLLGWIYLLKGEKYKKYDNPRSFLKIGLIWLAIPSLISVVVGFGFGLTSDRESLNEAWQENQQVMLLVNEKMASQKSTAKQDKTPESINNEEPLIETGTLIETDRTVNGNEESDSDKDIIDGEGIEEEAVEKTAEEKISEQVDSMVLEKTAALNDQNEEITAFTQESYWEATKFRISFSVLMLLLSPISALSMYLPIFLIGYWFIASGVLKNHKEHGALFKPMAWIGLGLGFPFTIGGLLVLQHPASENIMMLLATGNVLFLIGQYVTAAGYLGLVICLLGSDKWAKRLNYFSPLGRMALTNYIMHSVILTSIFYGYAGGMFAQVSRAPQMLIVIVIIVLQLLFSHWWLKRYQFGPLEWLWRSLTYKQIQPMQLL